MLTSPSPSGGKIGDIVERLRADAAAVMKAWDNRYAPEGVGAGIIVPVEVQTMLDAASALESLQARLAEAEGVIEPFATAFETRRDRYAKRYQDKALGYSNFDKMPGEWPMENLSFSMAALRAASRFLSDRGDAE